MKKVVNEFYGDIVKYHTAGVDLELIVVEFPIEDKPGVARCIDRVGTRHIVLTHRIRKTDQKASTAEITRIIAAAYARNNPKAKEVQAS